MAQKADLANWLRGALVDLGGKARIAPVCKHIWENHEGELRDSDDLLYTWQYDVRWAATELRKKLIMKPAHLSPRGVWELA